MARDDGIGIFTKALYAVMEPFTKAHPVIRIQEANVLAGNAFEASSTGYGLIPGATLKMQFTMPPVNGGGPIAWDIGTIFSTAYAKYQAFILDTPATGGTTVEIFNHNQWAPKASQMVIVKNPNADEVVLRSIEEILIGTPSANPAGKGHGAGLGTSGQNIWIMEPERSYLFTITNIDIINIDVQLKKFWFEWK